LSQCVGAARKGLALIALSIILVLAWSLLAPRLAGPAGLPAALAVGGILSSLLLAAGALLVASWALSAAVAGLAAAASRFAGAAAALALTGRPGPGELAWLWLMRIFGAAYIVSLVLLLLLLAVRLSGALGAAVGAGGLIFLACRLVVPLAADAVPQSPLFHVCLLGRLAGLSLAALGLLAASLRGPQG